VRVLGVDGAPGGWVGATWDGEALVLLYRPSLAELFAAAGSPAVIGVDMPLGLVRAGARRAELAARDFLGARRSSVFLSPVRAVLDRGEFADYASANAHLRSLGEAGLSRQSFGLLPKIAEVISFRAGVGADVREVHPEVSFQVLAGRPLRASKKTWVGACERRALLEGAGLHPPEDAETGRAGVDDVLDAVVVAWTAARVVAGTARPFPADVEPDEIAIWA